MFFFLIQIYLFTLGNKNLKKSVQKWKKMVHDRSSLGYWSTAYAPPPPHSVAPLTLPVFQERFALLKFMLIGFEQVFYNTPFPPNEKVAWWILAVRPGASSCKGYINWREFVQWDHSCNTRVKYCMYAFAIMLSKIFIERNCNFRFFWFDFSLLRPVSKSRACMETFLLI